MSTSYWGMRGTEDLGAGWHATFTLEDLQPLAANGRVHRDPRRTSHFAFVGIDIRRRHPKPILTTCESCIRGGPVPPGLFHSTSGSALLIPIVVTKRAKQ